MPPMKKLFPRPNVGASPSPGIPVGRVTMAPDRPRSPREQLLGMLMNQPWSL